MKTVIVSAMLGLFGAAAFAQENLPAEPAQPSIIAPAEQVKLVVETPVVPAQPVVKAAPVWNNLPELNKSHGQAVADLKKKQEAAIKQLKTSMKGKPIPEMRAAVGKQRTSDKAALKTLKDAQNAEVEQFKKDHPEAVKKIEEVKKPKIKTPAVPEKK